jgi:hypothetical protein
MYKTQIEDNQNIKHNTETKRLSNTPSINKPETIDIRMYLSANFFVLNKTMLKCFRYENTLKE